jgi:Ribosomal protein S10p/S20e
MLFNLTIRLKSNNIKSFLLYLTVLYAVLNKLYIINKVLNKRNHLTVFALLKSPHVNKTAQQHFGFKFYNNSIQIIVKDLVKLILWIKLLKSQLFTDISLSITYTINMKLLCISNLVIHFNKRLFKFLNFVHLITLKVLLKANNLMV